MYEVFILIYPKRIQNFLVIFSMMDHYYDKLLQIARFDADVVKNSYLCQEASKAGQSMIVQDLFSKFLLILASKHCCTGTGTYQKSLR
jgi:hypothetical protein